MVNERLEELLEEFVGGYTFTNHIFITKELYYEKDIRYNQLYNYVLEIHKITTAGGDEYMMQSLQVFEKYVRLRQEIKEDSMKDYNSN